MAVLYQEKIILTVFIFSLAVLGCLCPFFITRHFSTIADRCIALITSFAGSVCFTIGMFLFQEGLEQVTELWDTQTAKIVVISSVVATYYLLFCIDLIGKFYGKEHNNLLNDGCGAHELSKPLLTSKDTLGKTSEHPHHHTCQTVDVTAQNCLTKSLGVSKNEVIDEHHDTCGNRDCEAYCCESDEEQHIEVCVKNPEACPHPNGLHPPEITQASNSLNRLFKLPFQNPLSIHRCSYRNDSNEKSNIDFKIDSKKMTDRLVSALFFLCFSIHSVIEGIGLGSTKYTTKFGLGIALHKGLAGFAIGASLIHAKLPILRFLFAVLTFSLMTPVGVLIGALATSLDSKHLLTGIFTSISAATFLYISVNGMIARAFMRQQVMSNTKL